MLIAEQCYELTRSFPRDELFGMTSQIRRAAASVPANIAEGQGRETTAAFVQFLRIAQGSLKELETHLLLSVRVGVSRSDLVNAILLSTGSLGRQLRALIRSLQRKVG